MSIVLCSLTHGLLSSEEEPFSIHQERLTALLTHLVSMDTTTSNHEGNLEALKWVARELKPLGLHTTFYEFNKYPSLVMTTSDTRRPDLWLVAHMDVVPASPSLFYPKIEGGKMYGRGAYDMKMAIACYLLLMQEMVGELEDYNIGLILTSDEEVGGMNGVRAILNEGYSSEIAFLPDGGFDWNFEEAAKGVLHLQVISQGVSAHSSRPWLGENAIDSLMHALSAIHRYFEEHKRVSSAYYPTVNVGVIQGGKQINQVPDYAEAMLDIRFPPNMSSEKIRTDLEEIVQKYPQIALKKIIEGSPHSAEISNPFFQKFKEIAKQLYGIDVGTMRAHGSSDARFFGEKNIPTLVIAPRGGEIHSDHEWVDLEDLTRFYEVMEKWIKYSFKNSPTHNKT